MWLRQLITAQSPSEVEKSFNLLIAKASESRLRDASKAEIQTALSQNPNFAINVANDNHEKKLVREEFLRNFLPKIIYIKEYFAKKQKNGFAEIAENIADEIAYRLAILQLTMNNAPYTYAEVAAQKERLLNTTLAGSKLNEYSATLLKISKKTKIYEKEIENKITELRNANNSKNITNQTVSVKVKFLTNQILPAITAYKKSVDEEIKNVKLNKPQGTEVIKTNLNKLEESLVDITKSLNEESVFKRIKTFISDSWKNLFFIKPVLSTRSTINYLSENINGFFSKKTASLSRTIETLLPKTSNETKEEERPSSPFSPRDI